MTDHRRGWRSTGRASQATGKIDKIPPFDSRTGDHYWIMINTYHVDPKKWEDPTHVPMLDIENLVLVTGPGCFYCERVYSEAKDRRCKGRPWEA